ncbi:hypothetical protein N7456_007660 [Penicillium angulare]|uniref:Uncharacterized protein n=1 Tax=Penicillium angulare TaxID=116970 RepID=A0A9W9FB56_9EURO|nr:hypothetical protein N7456_007660 [Penicillium angulare]
MLINFCGWTLSEGSGVFGEPDYLYPPPPRLWPALAELGISLERRYQALSIKQTVNKVVYGGPSNNEQLVVNDYFLQTGPGVLFSLSSRRSYGWHWSEVALAAYRQYETAELRYVFRVDVTNAFTLRTVARIYQMNGKTWPSPFCWSYGTPEYQALLSTPNGRGVAALVIGGYEAGTRFISQICTWADPENQCLQMLFVISNPNSV